VCTRLYVRQPFTHLSHAPPSLGAFDGWTASVPIPSQSQCHPIPTILTYIHTHTTYIQHPIPGPHTPTTNHHTVYQTPSPPLCYCSFLPFELSPAQPGPLPPGALPLAPETISISPPSPPPPPTLVLRTRHFLAPIITSSCYAPTYRKRLPAREPATTTCDLPVWSLHKYCPVLFYDDAASAVLRYIHTVLPAQPSWPKSPRPSAALCPWPSLSPSPRHLQSKVRIDAHSSTSTLLHPLRSHPPRHPYIGSGAPRPLLILR